MEILSIVEFFIPGMAVGGFLVKRPRPKAKTLEPKPKLLVEVARPENAEKYAIVIRRNGYQHLWPEECLTFEPHICNSKHKEISLMTSEFKRNALTWGDCWVSWIDSDATDEEITELVADARAKAEEWMNLVPAHEKARRLLNA